MCTSLNVTKYNYKFYAPPPSPSSGVHFHVEGESVVQAMIICVHMPILK